MSVLKYFKNTPGRPHRATGPKCIFFLQICNEVPGKKGGLSPPLPSSFEPENSTKNPEKKRGVRRRKAAKPCRIQHL